MKLNEVFRGTLMFGLLGSVLHIRADILCMSRQPYNSLEQQPNIPTSVRKSSGSAINTVPCSVSDRRCSYLVRPLSDDPKILARPWKLSKPNSIWLDLYCTETLLKLILNYSIFVLKYRHSVQYINEV